MWKSRRRPTCSFMRTNVGLLTTLVTPIPSATPFASCVLPAPSSPVRASTVPASADVPDPRPIARVAVRAVLRSGPATVAAPSIAPCRAV